MRASRLIARAGLLALLTMLALVVHETGHFLVYWSAGVPVRITLQSVHAAGPVAPDVDRWALLAGPVMSCMAAAGCLVAARAWPGFLWSSAAFTNATIRLFPLVMDVIRAISGDAPFSDEGNVVLSWTSSPAIRVLLLSPALLVCVALTVLAVRSYRFPNRAALRSIGIYLFTLVIGICILIADELLHR